MTEAGTSAFCGSAQMPLTRSRVMWRFQVTRVTWGGSAAHLPLPGKQRMMAEGWGWAGRQSPGGLSRKSHHREMPPTVQKAAKGQDTS